MKISIRTWLRSDFATISAHWLTAYRHVALPDAPLKSDALGALQDWLADRFRDRGATGYIAEIEGEFAGFLLGRVGRWESDPPIVKARRVGLIDVVYVVEGHRRCGVGTLLVEQMIERAESYGATVVETTFEVSNPSASAMWGNLDFVRWLHRVYHPTSHFPDTRLSESRPDD